MRQIYSVDRVINNVWKYCLLAAWTILIFLIVKSLVQPMNKGFQCHDGSVRKRQHVSVVSTGIYLTSGIVIFAITLLVLETARSDNEREELKHAYTVHQLGSKKVKIKHIREATIRIAGSFAVGMMSVAISVTIVQSGMGRPRPNYISACQPTILNNDKRDCLPGFPAINIFSNEYRCIDENYNYRKSWPCYDVSVFSYIVAFSALLVHYRWAWESTSGAPRKLIVILLFTSPSILGSTLVNNHENHFDDVIAGYVIGCVCAVIYGLQALFPEQYTLSLPKNRTATSIRLGVWERACG